MPRRPNSLTKFTHSAISLVGGIMVEVVFILWLILLILSAASVAVAIVSMVS